MKRASLWLLVAVVLLAAHYGLATAMLEGMVIGVGRLTLPTPGFTVLVATWSLFGTASAAALTAALALWLAGGRRGERWAARWRAVSDRTVLLLLTLLAVGAAAAVRIWLLRGVALADDEASYRFAARLIASGRLWVPSPPLKLHFDHAFLINDGRLQSAYFLGWPALAAPGVWLGAVGFMNALYFGASVPAVFLAARKLFGSAWARIATLLFVTSPFLIVLAATELAHTSCIAALAWMLWAFLRTREQDARPWHHGAVAVLFSVAFFVRPISALGLGGPVLLLWAIDRLRGGARRTAPVVAFAIPALVFAALFLGLQHELHGSPWKTSYRHAREYHLANQLRFTPWRASELVGTPGFHFDRPRRDFYVTAGGLLRLGADLFGWPIGLLFTGLAAGVRRSGLAWGMCAGGLAEVFFQKDPGIDSFGPVHYAELALPLVLLVAAAGSRIAAALEQRSEPGSFAELRNRVAVSGVAALCLTAWLGFVPFRWVTLGAIADNIRAPEAEAEQDAVRPAVVFASFRFIACQPLPAQHFRFLRPVSGPDLEDPIVWANHVSVESDRALMRFFPGRRGYAQVWTEDCRPHLLPLELASEKSLPPTYAGLRK